MNYATHVGELVDAYVRSQQQLWEDWLSVVQGSQGRPTSAAVWGRPLEAWAEQARSLVESQMKGVMDLQSVWLRRGVQEVNPWSGLPALMTEWAEQNQKLAEQTAGAGRQMLDGWIEAGRRFDVVRVAQAWNGTLQQAIEAWQESLDRYWEAQAILLLPLEEHPPAEKKAAGTKKTEASKPAAERAAAAS